MLFLLAIYVQIITRNHVHVTNNYNIGKDVVGSCGRTKRQSHQQHPSCYSNDFFCSHKDDITMVDSLPMEMTNYSNILPAEGRIFFENWSEGKTFFDNWRKKFNKQTSKKAEVPKARWAQIT